MASFLTPLLEKSPGVYQLRNARTGRMVATHLGTAFDSATRKTGLLKHTSLPPGEALIIAPTNAIHTWFMKFPIDVAFVARGGELVKIRHDMGPWRLSGAWKGYAVVEMAAGSFAAAETKVGDRLEVVLRKDA